MDKKKLIIAYHETGHAVMALICRQGVQKISLRELDSPRGTDKYLGFAKLEPFDQSVTLTINEANRRIMISLGGYASEILFLDGSAKIGGDDLTIAVKLVEAMLEVEDFKHFVSRLPIPDPGALDMIENPRARAYVDYQMHMTIQSLAPFKQLIQLIVDELLRTEELSGREVTAHFNTFMQSSLR